MSLSVRTKLDDGFAGKRPFAASLLNLAAPWIGPTVFVFEFIAVVAISMITGFLYEEFALGLSGDLGKFAAVGIATFADFAMVLAYRGNYTIVHLASRWRQLREVTVVWGLVCLFLLGVAFLLKIGPIFSRGATLLFFVFGWLFLVLWRFFLARYLTSATERGAIAEQRVLVLGDAEFADATARLNELRQGGYDPVKVFTIGRDTHGKVTGSRELDFVAKELKDLLRLRLEGEGDTVRVVLQDPNADDDALLMVDRIRFEDGWTGEVILVKRDYEISDEDQPFGLGLVAALLFRERWVVRDVIICAFMMSILALMPIMFWRLMSDKVLYYRAYNTFWVLCAAMLILLIFESIFTYVRQFLILHMTTRLDVKLTTSVFEKVLNLPIDFFERTQAGKIFHDMWELRKIRSFMVGQLFGTILDSTTLLVFIPIMFFFSPIMTAAVLACCALMVLWVLAMMPFYRKKSNAAEKAATEQASFLVQTINGIRTVKTLALDARQRHVGNCQIQSVCLLGGSAAVAAQKSSGPIEIWFKPLTWNLKVPGPGIEYTKYDFTALLQPDAPWQAAASHVSVLLLPGNLVWSYPDLQLVVAFIKAHHFKVAFADGMLFTGGTCGKGIEGMSQDPDANRETLVIAQKWKAAGGTLDYIIMDGPLYYGHHYAKDCNYSIPEVATRVGATLNGVRKYFPDIHVVDAEGPGEFSDDQWLGEMATWFKEFQQATERPIEAVVLDLHWHDRRPGNSWQNTARRAAATFHQLGVRSGLIMNADSPPGTTDAEWMDANREHIRDAAAADLGLDFVEINSWQNHPSRNLPETDPTANTSLVDYTAQTWK